MFRNNIIKIIISFLGLSVLTIGFLVLWLSYDLPQTRRAWAVPGSIDQGWVPLQGWAWVGAPNACVDAACGANPSPSWISFNCRNNNSDANCQNTGPDYWVAVKEDSGELDGYAWSDHVGWVDFKPPWADIIAAGLDTGIYVNCEADCQAPNNCSVCYNKTARKFYGWARILSEADAASVYDNGWIKLDGVLGGTDYGAKADKFDGDDNDIEEATGLPEGGAPWGDLSGWAWNGAKALNFDDSPIGPNATSGLGWISFNCNNPGAGGCASPYQYQVSGRPNALGNLQVTRIDGDDSHGLNIDWSNGYPGYGTTWYEVWRQNGQCYDGSEAVGEDCNFNVDCSRGTCDLTLPYAKKQTTTSGSFYYDQPLNLFVTYHYIVRNCNIFGCAKTSDQGLLTSPIQEVPNFKAVPICAANAQTASYVDMTWSSPYIVTYSGISVDHYQLQYCKTDVAKGTDCANWYDAVADCAGANLGAGSLSCREKLLQSDSRYRSQDFYVYRLRAIGDKGACVGGGNDGLPCATDNDCLPNGVCTGYNDIWKSSWSYSNVFRICPVGTSYKEERPQ